MRRNQWLARITGLALLVALGFAGTEFARGRRGPTPLPTPESMASGRVLLEKMLDATGARWASTDTVSFVVTPVQLGHPGAELAIRFDPKSRILVAQPLEPHGRTIVFDPSNGSVTPDDDKTLRTLLPSIDFWTIAPGVFDDPDVILWRLPDVSGRSRVAARWPDQADWFILESAPGSDRFESLEFVDSRFGVLLRWRGRYEGPLTGGAAPLPGSWRFRAASPVIDALLGHRDLVTLHFRRS